MKLIVSGNKYSDIDVLACSVALKNIYDLQKIDALICISENFNESITPKLKQLVSGLSFIPDEMPRVYEVTVVDISDPEHIDKRINQGNITEVFDHHFGYEELWKGRLGDKSRIVEIGACATLIWEYVKSLNLQNSLSHSTKQLLAAAIVSNTLNFNASVTKEADKAAFQYLGFDGAFIQEYFSDVEKYIMLNPEQAIKSSIKHQTISGVEYAMAQIELWDSREFLQKNTEVVSKILNGKSCLMWFYTSPSISEGKNY